MVINRTPPRRPRQGPSCMMVLVIGLVLALGAFVATNAEEVRDTLTPDPTPEPTRSAASYAASAALMERDGDYAEAVQAYEAAVRLEPSRVEFYIPLIDLLVATNQAEAALDWAEKAIILEPEDDKVWAALAAAHLAYGQRLVTIGEPTDALLSFASAERAARTAINLNPNNANAYAYIAGALARPGPEHARRYAEAQEAADTAVAIDPDNPTAHRYRADILALQGYYTAAIDSYLMALNLNPNRADLHIGLAYNYFATQNIPLAIQTFLDALEVDPDNAAAYDGVSYMYFLIGEHQRAEENAAKAVELDPDMVRAHAHLGAALYRNQNYEAAIESLETAVERYGSVSAQNAIYFNMLGLAYYYTDDSRCTEANILFNSVLEVLPDDYNANEGLRLCRAATLGSSP